MARRGHHALLCKGQVAQAVLHYLGMHVGHLRTKPADPVKMS